MAGRRERSTQSLECTAQQRRGRWIGRDSQLDADTEKKKRPEGRPQR
jgi:hypothetical protein